MCISNNRPSFPLWWKENLVKHRKVSKYYETDCGYILTYFIKSVRNLYFGLVFYIIAVVSITNNLMLWVLCLALTNFISCFPFVIFYTVLFDTVTLKNKANKGTLHKVGFCWYLSRGKFSRKKAIFQKYMSMGNCSDEIEKKSTEEDNCQVAIGTGGICSRGDCLGGIFLITFKIPEGLKRRYLTVINNF